MERVLSNRYVNSMDSLTVIFRVRNKLHAEMIQKNTLQSCLHVDSRTFIKIEGILTLWSIFSDFAELSKRQFPKWVRFHGKKPLGAGVTKRRVIFMDSLTVKFRVPNTLHASRMREIFTTELLASGLQHFHPPYKAYWHFEEFSQISQVSFNASFENEAELAEKCSWRQFYPKDNNLTTFNHRVIPCSEHVTCTTDSKNLL